MVEKKNVIVFDLDGTLCTVRKSDQSYEQLAIVESVVSKLKEYKANGFYIIIQTARQMKTYEGNVGKINANTAKVTFDWLEKNEIEYDEIYFGKPWCGSNGFYVDDKAIRPSEFSQLSFEEIQALLSREGQR